MDNRVAGAAAGRQFRFGSLDLDLDGYRATFRGRTLCLSPSQLEMLGLLLANPDRIVSREELAGAVGLHRDRSVDVMLCAIRKELGRNFLRNVRKRGWIVDPESLAA